MLESAGRFRWGPDKCGIATVADSGPESEKNGPVDRGAANDGGFNVATLLGPEVERSEREITKIRKVTSRRGRDFHVDQCPTISDFKSQPSS